MPRQTVTRYARIALLTDLRVWTNPTAVRTYVYLCCKADYRTHTVAKSYRIMTQEINCSIAALRHSLKVLEQAGLVTVRKVDGRTVIYTDIVQSDTETATISSKADIVTYLRQHTDKCEAMLKAKHGSLHPYIEPFADMQVLAGREYSSGDKLLNHYCNWILRNRPALSKQVEAETERAKAAAEAQYQAERTAQQQTVSEAVGWRKLVAELRAAAQRGNTRAQAQLNKPEVQLAITTYNL